MLRDVSFRIETTEIPGVTESSYTEVVGASERWLALFRENANETDVFRLNDQGQFHHLVKCPGLLNLFVATETLLICDKKVFKIDANQCLLVQEIDGYSGGAVNGDYVILCVAETTRYHIYKWN